MDTSALPPLGANNVLYLAGTDLSNPQLVNPANALLPTTALFPCPNDGSTKDYLCQAGYYLKLSAVNIAIFILVLLALWVIFK